MPTHSYDTTYRAKRHGRNLRLRPRRQPQQRRQQHRRLGSPEPPTSKIDSRGKTLAFTWDKAGNILSKTTYQ